MITIRNVLCLLLLAFGSVAYADQRLLGKKAIVTGANKGIGKAIALGFAKEGAEVVIGYCSDKEAAFATLEQISAAGVKATAIQVDMSQSESIAQFFLESVNFLGDVDVLVNNAGIVSYLPFLETTESDLDHVMDVNFKGPFLLLQHFSRYIESLKHGGSVINVSSISATLTVPNLVAYQCSKAALSMLTKGTAIELAPGIRINTLAPGLIATDLNRFLWEGDTAGWEQLSKIIPLGRTGFPDDQVGAAIFLASDESSWMTGSCITIDGGAERR